MKNIILFFLIFTRVLGAAAQPGFIEAFYTDGNQQEIAHYIDVVVDHDTIVLYALAFDENNKQGVLFAKLDTFGKVLQETIVVDSNSTLTTTSYRKKLIRTQDGGYAIFGSAGLPVAYLLKVNHDLEPEFLQKYTEPNGATLLNTTLLEVEDGFLLVGYHVNPGAYEHNIFILKTDKSGNELWRKVIDDEPDVHEMIIDINRVGDDFLLMGSKAEHIPVAQATWAVPLLVMIDEDGNNKWTWSMDKDLLPGEISHGYMLPDSSWIFVGATWELEEGGGSYASRPIVFRLDKGKNIVWQKAFGFVGLFQWFKDLVRTPDGNFVVSGNLWNEYAPSVLSSKAVHYKFSADGDSIWMRQDSVLEDSWVYGTDVLSSGSIISVGYTRKFGPGGGEFGFVMKIGPDGCIDTLHCWDGVTGTEVIARAEGIRVYPNPALNQVTFTGIATGDIIVMDIHGREVKRLKVNGFAPVEWRFGSLLPGLYIWYLMNDGRVIDRGKILVE